MTTFDRRTLLRAGTAGLAGLAGSRLLGIAPALAADPGRPASALYDAVIEVFLEGGPSQTDSFDPKPRVPESEWSASVPRAGSQFDSIALGANDAYGNPIRLSENLSDLRALVQANPAVGLGIVRSLVHKNGEHQLAQSWMHCFREAGPAELHPSTAAAMAWYFRDDPLRLPSVVVRGSNGMAVNDAKGNPVPTALLAFSGSSLDVNPTQQLLQMPVEKARYDRRHALVDLLNGRFRARHADGAASAWGQAADSARAMTERGEAAKLFDLSRASLLPARDRSFALDLTLAQNLVIGEGDRFVRFVSVGLGGNDTHGNVPENRNSTSVRRIWREDVGPAVAAMAGNLARSGRRVLVLIGGEFGRTPQLHGDGRGHHANGFSWGMLSINQPRFRTGAWGDTGPDGTSTLGNGLRDPAFPGTLGALVYRSLGIPFSDRAYWLPNAADARYRSEGKAPPVEEWFHDLATPMMKAFGLA